MSDIRSLLIGSNGLQSLSHMTKHLTASSPEKHVVFSEINSRVKQINHTVDRKVSDLYHNILNNFSRTILPGNSQSLAVEDLQSQKLYVENHNRDQFGIISGQKRDSHDLIPLRKRKQILAAQQYRQSEKKQQNTDKENNGASQTPSILVSKTKMYPPDEKRGSAELREGTLAILKDHFPMFPSINSRQAKKDQKIRSAKQLKHSSYRTQRQSSVVVDHVIYQPLLNEKALIEKYDSQTFKIVNHELDDSSVQFLDFQRQHNANWDRVTQAIAAILKFSKNNSLPDTKLDPKKIIWLSTQPQPFKAIDVIGCFNDIEELLVKIDSKELRYYGKVGRVRAATKIQAWYRMIRERHQYFRMKILLTKIRKIQASWRCYRELQNTRTLIREGSTRILERFEDRQSQFRRNWQHIKLQQRVEIHINSSSIDELKRLTSERFTQKQNCQITRIFKLKDPCLTIVYVSPFPLSEQIIAYYNKVLEISQAYDAKRRLVFVWPEQRFSDHSCVCENVLYSPACIKRIKSIIKGKVAYLVPGYPSNAYLKIADVLDVPVYGGLPSKCNHLSSKAGSRQLSQRHLPFETDMYTTDQVIRSLAALIIKNPRIDRWFFKINDERYARGNAYIDVGSIKQIKKIRYQTGLTEMSPEFAMIYECLEAKLPQKLRVVHKNLFKSYDEFIAMFISRGGVIEASPIYPESKIISSTFLMEIEPGGSCHMLSSYDKVMWHLKPIGCQYPSELTVPAEELQTMAKKLYRHGVIGYVSLDYLSCPDHYWFLGVDCYLNNLSAIYFTAAAVSMYQNPQSTINKQNQGTIAVSTGEKSSQQPLRFLYCPFIIHNGLVELQMRTFFHLCRLANISFDINRRIGSIFIFMDTLQSSTLGLMSFCDNNYGLYRYMSNAFDFLGSRLDPLKSQIYDDPRTDYISFQEMKNKFRSIIKQTQKQRQHTYNDRLLTID